MEISPCALASASSKSSVRSTDCTDWRGRLEPSSAASRSFSTRTLPFGAGRGSAYRRPSSSGASVSPASSVAVARRATRRAEELAERRRAPLVRGVQCRHGVVVARRLELAAQRPDAPHDGARLAHADAPGGERLLALDGVLD